MSDEPNIKINLNDKYNLSRSSQFVKLNSDDGELQLLMNNERHDNSDEHENLLHVCTNSSSRNSENKHNSSKIYIISHLNLIPSTVWNLIQIIKRSANRSTCAALIVGITIGLLLQNHTQLLKHNAEFYLKSHSNISHSEATTIPNSGINFNSDFNIPPPPFDNPYSKLPSTAISIRSYSGMFHEILHFHLSYMLFWPNLYCQSKIIWIFDDETSKDHYLGSLLLNSYGRFRPVYKYSREKANNPDKEDVYYTHKQCLDSISNLPSYQYKDLLDSPVSVFYEQKPVPEVLTNVWRGYGYCRQQWSNFYLDLYTNLDYVSIYDSDVFFFRTPSPDDLFNSKTMKPIIIGYNSADTAWCESAEWLVGGKCPGEFMIAFPVTIKTCHFRLMREHIISHLNVPTFEQAWDQLMKKYGNQRYSQFDIMATYLFNFQRDEYDWRINSCGEACKHPYQPHLRYKLDGPLEQLELAKAVFSYNIPTTRYAKHQWNEAWTMDMIDQMYRFMCMNTNFTSGECIYGRDPDSNTESQLIRSFYIEGITWGPYPQTELPWTAPGRPDFIQNYKSDQLLSLKASYESQNWKNFKNYNFTNVRPRWPFT